MNSTFYENFNENLSYYNLDQVEIDENITNNSTNGTLDIQTSITIDPSTEKYNLSFLLTLKSNGSNAIIVYAFLINDSNSSNFTIQNFTNFIPSNYTGEEFFGNETEGFDFKGKEYLKSNSTVNLTLIFLNKSAVIDFYYVTDMNLTNSTNVSLYSYIYSNIGITGPPGGFL